MCVIIYTLCQIRIGFRVLLSVRGENCKITMLTKLISLQGLIMFRAKNAYLYRDHMEYSSNECITILQMTDNILKRRGRP